MPIISKIRISFTSFLAVFERDRGRVLRPDPRFEEGVLDLRFDGLIDLTLLEDLDLAFLKFKVNQKHIWHMTWYRNSYQLNNYTNVNELFKQQHS